MQAKTKQKTKQKTKNKTKTKQKYKTKHNITIKPLTVHLFLNTAACHKCKLKTIRDGD